MESKCPKSYLANWAVCRNNVNKRLKLLNVEQQKLQGNLMLLLVHIPTATLAQIQSFK